MLNPTAKLGSFLFKGRRLSQASLELSSSRGVWQPRKGEKEEREERKEIKAKPKLKDFIYKNKNLQKILPNCCFTDCCLSLQNKRGFI